MPLGRRWPSTSDRFCGPFPFGCPKNPEHRSPFRSKEREIPIGRKRDGTDDGERRIAPQRPNLTRIPTTRETNERESITYVTNHTLTYIYTLNTSWIFFNRRRWGPFEMSDNNNNNNNAEPFSKTHLEKSIWSIYRHCQCALLFILMCLFLFPLSATETASNGDAVSASERQGTGPLKSIGLPQQSGQLFLVSGR